MMIQNIRCRSQQLLASSSSSQKAGEIINYPSFNSALWSSHITKTALSTTTSSPLKKSKSFLSVTSNKCKSFQQRTPQFDMIYSSSKLLICDVAIGSKIQNCLLSSNIHNLFQRFLTISSTACNNYITAPTRSSLSAKSISYINKSATNNRLGQFYTMNDKIRQTMNTTTKLTTTLTTQQKRMKHTLKVNSSVSKRFRTRRGKGGIHTLVRGRSGAQHNTGYKSRSKSNFLGTSTTIKNKKIHAKMKRCMQLN